MPVLRKIVKGRYGIPGSKLRLLNLQRDIASLMQLASLHGYGMNWLQKTTIAKRKKDW